MFTMNPDHVARLVNLLEELNRLRGMTIVMVTHDHAVAGRAGRVVTLDAGRLIEPEPAHI